MIINDLELKLIGDLPIDRNELLYLVNSWGRICNTITDDYIKIEKCEAKECYDLSKLDVSQIDDFSNIFDYSPYNGDLSKWDVSMCTNMKFMFWCSDFNNNSISNWNISNCTILCGTFGESKFNGDLSKWDISKVIDTSRLFQKSKFNNDSINKWNVSNILFMNYMFEESLFTKDISKWKFNKEVIIDYFFSSSKFENMYNNGNEIPDITEDFLEWFENNRENIANSSITKEDKLEIDDYLISFDKELDIIK